MLYKKYNIIWRRLDWWIVCFYFLLVTAGWFCIHAATQGSGSSVISNRATMQLIWIGSAFCIAFILLIIKSDYWYETFAFTLYVFIILLLIVTIFLATPIKGSRSWLAWGPLRIQPAEFAKVATALAVAKAIEAYRSYKISMGKICVISMLIFLPILFIFLQRETGSALVFLVFFLVLFREGMSSKILSIGFSSVILFILVVRYSNIFFSKFSTISLGELYGFAFILVFIIAHLWFSNSKLERKMAVHLFCFILIFVLIFFSIERFANFNFCWFVILSAISSFVLHFLFLFIKRRKTIYLWLCFFTFYSSVFVLSTNFIFDNVLEVHQKIRIQVAFGLVNDPSGAGYNINQSKIAIGSGGFIGKGYLKGTQTKLKYVPEQETDFVFCTLGEEGGFVSSAVFVILFSCLIIRLIWLAEKQRRVFDRAYGYCVACILFFHFSVNIGMVLGLTPVIGIPLPFCSYGGSSLWAFTILLFIFVRLDSSRKKILC